MTRSQRHMKILELISAHDIETQEEIVERLKTAGYNFTQATISRDIKDMGLVKVLTEDKHYKYVYVNSEIKNLSTKLLNVFKEAVISINYSVNNIVIKTLSGSASPAAALVDKLNISSILGCIAGDDTIIIIIDSIANTQEVYTRLCELIK